MSAPIVSGCSAVRLLAGGCKPVAAVAAAGSTRPTAAVKAAVVDALLADEGGAARGRASLAFRTIAITRPLATWANLPLAAEYCHICEWSPATHAARWIGAAGGGGGGGGGGGTGGGLLVRPSTVFAQPPAHGTASSGTVLARSKVTNPNDLPLSKNSSDVDECLIAVTLLADPNAGPYGCPCELVLSAALKAPLKARYTHAFPG
jgi:hypothetical protein